MAEGVESNGQSGGASNPRVAALMEERARLNESFPETLRVIDKEVEMELAGLDKSKFIEIHNPMATKAEFRVRIPVKEFPQANFVGKIVGPGGATIGSLSEQSGCRLAVFGRGSIRDKGKEEEFRKQGGKYAHLNTDLHLFVEASGAPITHCYQKLGHALSVIQPIASTRPSAVITVTRAPLAAICPTQSRRGATSSDCPGRGGVHCGRRACAMRAIALSCSKPARS
jgi:hypothetical protein